MAVLLIHSAEQVAAGRWLTGLNLTEEQLLKRRQAFLPSALAANKGFDECAQLLRAAGM